MSERKNWLTDEKHKELSDKYDHYVCDICSQIGAKVVIAEFLRDFKWYLAFLTHFHWIGSPACKCKTDPVYFEKWIIEKWQGMLN